MDKAYINSQTSSWLNSPLVDEKSKQEILHLEKNNPNEWYESFYTNLEFGTGGLRGIMGVGNNRMNKYTVGKATQGFANYLKKSCTGKIKIIVGHDCRNNSPFFAQTVANVMAANDIEVLLFAELRPTPQLSYLLRHYGCQAGVVCTASHNPKEYNGYKAYWSDGGQLTPPHDKNVITEVNAIPSFERIKWEDSSKKHLISLLGEEADQTYINMVVKKTLHADIIQQQSHIKIVYTPIHGTGITILPRVLERLGFKNIHIISEQSVPDGNFPTVIYPNPEEQEAMSIGLAHAKKIDASLLLGTDPDSDRLAIAVKDDTGNLLLLNGNQLALLAFNYVLEEHATNNHGKVKSTDMVVKTIVSSPMIDVVASSYGCACYNVLTGFKWIAELIKEKEGKEKFLIGGEESFGLMWGDECRDKDAISAAALFCEMAAVEASKGSSIFQKLLSLYKKHGFYYESLLSISKKGIEGKKEIDALMEKLRHHSPTSIDGIAVKTIKDYERSISIDVATKKEEKITLPKSNVLQFVLEDGSLISGRPSGTEPKIKFYFSVRIPYSPDKTYAAHTQLAMEKIKRMEKSLQLA